MKQKTTNIFKKILKPPETIVTLASLAISVLTQYPAITNKYIVNDDTNQHIWWMQQYLDNTLFKNDLLALYAKQLQPWGLQILYKTTSTIINPLILSKIIPIFLIIISSLFLFKLIKFITNSNTAGYIGFLLFATNINFIQAHSGGHARTFAYPLLILFLYFLIKKESKKSYILLLLQSLFYPITFLISAATSILNLFRIKQKRIKIIESPKKLLLLLLCLIFGLCILISHQKLTYNQKIGHLINKKEMIKNPAFYKHGRTEKLPTPSLIKEIDINLKSAIINKHNIEHHTKTLKSLKVQLPSSFINIFGSCIFLILLALLLTSKIKNKKHLPLELIYLFISSILLYEIASVVQPKILWPNRYVCYSLPILGIIIISSALTSQIQKNQKKSKIYLYATSIIIFISINLITILKINISNKPYKLIPDQFHKDLNIGLTDYSHNKDLFQFLRTLPKDAIIASHPTLSDAIPLFTQKRVFINHELSQPFYEKYWETIQKRTLALFKAYYSNNPDYIYDFCQKNNIDYLVIHEETLSKKYIHSRKIYFEPFNQQIESFIHNNYQPALMNIKQQNKVYEKNNIFVIHKNALQKK
jgi:hypothetical protein